MGNQEKKFDLAKKEPRKVFYVDFTTKTLMSVVEEEIENEELSTEINDDEAAFGLLR